MSGTCAHTRACADGTLLWQTTTPFAEGRAVASDVVVQPGRIVAVGVVFPPTGPRFALAGYELTGDQDATFRNSGTQDTAFPGGGAGGSGAVLTSGGQILVAGQFGAAEETFALARYTASGQLDTTFQTEGQTTTPFSQGDAGAVDVVQEPCGALAAGGGIVSPTELFALAGYGADGTLNAGFGTAGTQITAFPNVGASASAFALAPGDKLVAAGGRPGRAPHSSRSPATRARVRRRRLLPHQQRLRHRPHERRWRRSRRRPRSCVKTGRSGSRCAAGPCAWRAVAGSSDWERCRAARPRAAGRGRVHVARPCALLDRKGAARDQDPEGEPPGAPGARGLAAGGGARHGTHPPAERRDPDRRAQGPRADRGRGSQRPRRWSVAGAQVG